MRAVGEAKRIVSDMKEDTEVDRAHRGRLLADTRTAFAHRLKDDGFNMAVGGEAVNRLFPQTMRSECHCI